MKSERFMLGLFTQYSVGPNKEIILKKNHPASTVVLRFTICTVVAKSDVWPRKKWHLHHLY